MISMLSNKHIYYLACAARFICCMVTYILIYNTIIFLRAGIYLVVLGFSVFLILPSVLNLFFTIVLELLGSASDCTLTDAAVHCGSLYHTTYMDGLLKPEILATRGFHVVPLAHNAYAILYTQARYATTLL